MSDQKGQVCPPQLFTVDSNAKAIYRRWQCWPDSLLTGDVMLQLAKDPDRLPEADQSNLRQAGLLQEVAGRFRPAIPIYEQLPLAEWREEMQKSVSTRGQELTEAVATLKDSWTSSTRLPDWDGVAHNLLLGYLLWGVGSRSLLALCETEVLAVIVTDPARSVGIWHGFVRANQEHGVSTLLGEQFSQSVLVQSLLYRPEVAQALRTLAADRSLLVLHPYAQRVLQRLAALVTERADETGLHHLAWPALDPTDLGGPQEELKTVLAGVHSLQRESLLRQAADGANRFPWLQRGDLALAAYSLLVRELADWWVGAGLLPPLISPRLGDLR